MSVNQVGMYYHKPLSQNIETESIVGCGGFPPFETSLKTPKTAKLKKKILNDEIIEKEEKFLSIYKN